VQHHVPIMIVETTMRVMLGSKKESQSMTSRCFDMLAVIYDSDKPNARLIGLEYIISSELFEGLPEEEKVYWHSHKFEVSSGTLQVCHQLLQVRVAVRAAITSLKVKYVTLAISSTSSQTCLFGV